MIGERVWKVVGLACTTCLPGVEYVTAPGFAHCCLLCASLICAQMGLAQSQGHLSASVPRQWRLLCMQALLHS